ncbi:hypothetical protein F2P81_011045 [Scophthalmus maximus]|uniref:Uncharacterized protein n=1 Tax=Scophthalmus maximus TaxID=52904 RepID=A0A6A4SP24_SCOMX|nr:hypothetical protein F2P81_011045 [Scophthalmus maximus]
MFTGLRRPSSDHLDPESSSHGDPGGIIGGGGGGGEEEEEEWAGSSCSVCSDRFWSRSSRFSSDDSYQLDSGEDCAELLLACLYCRFHEVMLLLPETCERALSRCFPSYRHMAAASDGDESAADCCGRTLDCRLSDSCQDAGDLVELAMEISEGSDVLSADLSLVVFTGSDSLIGSIVTLNQSPPSLQSFQVLVFISGLLFSRDCSSTHLGFYGCDDDQGKSVY